MARKQKEKIDADILIYSKWCVECDYQDELQEIINWTHQKNLKYKVIRTAYHPSDHKKAAELWATANDFDLETKEGKDKAQAYPTFVVYNDISTIQVFAERIEEKEDVKDDVHRLPKASRRKRKNRVASTKNKDLDCIEEEIDV